MESTEQKYRRLIARADAGEPIIELAAEAGVKPATLRWWRSELRRRDREQGSVPKRRKEIAGDLPRFLPVRLSAPSEAAATPIELITDRGRVVLRPGFDEGTLARLLAVLERASC